MTPTWAIWSNDQHPQNQGGIRVGSWAQKPALSLKRRKIGPRLLWRTNRKLQTRFCLVPKSMTLDIDLERPIRTLAEKMRLTEPTRKIWMKIDPYCQRHKFRPMILFSRNIRYMRILAGVSREGDAIRQWGWRQYISAFSEISVAIFCSETLYSISIDPRRLFSDPEVHDLEWPWIAIHVKFWLPCWCEIFHTLLSGRVAELFVCGGVAFPMYIVTRAWVCSVSA